MRLSIISAFWIVLGFLPVMAATPAPVIDRSAFYTAIASDNITVIDAQLAVLKTASGADKDAFEGALLMKKAGLVAKTKEKMSLFKAGRGKLEIAIDKENNNAEYRFLRLLIQENAPKIVNYRSDVTDDIAVIKANYKALPASVQQAIADYSKKSKALKL